MKKSIWLIAAALILQNAPACAEVYRCRDASGTLVLTDDPSKFPEGCVPVKEKEVGDVVDPGAFSIMESTESPEVTTDEVQEAVRQQEAETAREQSRVDRWVKLAQELALTYEKAEARRNDAYSSWSYDSREIVKQSLETMSQVQAQKQELLRDMQGKYIPAPARQTILQALDRIPAPE